MLGSPPPPIDDVRKTRSDGEKSRERLLVAGLALFSERGFARTSTREIALAAGANVASISYYFGDKAGLYRSVFAELMPHDLRDLSRIMAPGRPLRAALHDMFGTLLAPLREGAMARQCISPSPRITRGCRSASSPSASSPRTASKPTYSC